MYTIQIPGIKQYDTQMAVHTAPKTYDVSLALKFQKHLSNELHKRCILDHDNKKMSIKKVDKQRVSCAT